MLKIKDIRFRYIYLIIYVFMLISTSAYTPLGAVLAPDPLPFKPWGTIMKNGNPAPHDLELSAWCGAIKYASTITQDVDSSTWYAITVLGDNTSTPAFEGCPDGATVVFKIEGMETEQTATWVVGQNNRFDLTYCLQNVYLPLILN